MDRENRIDPTRYADAVRADREEAAQLGNSGVPFIVFDRRYAVSGAQSATTFTQALEQAWNSRSPLTVLTPAEGAENDEGCGPQGCAVAERDVTV
ncbi:hypothetical protein C6Y14_12365 [Streptomyces dioscori]|uniref:DSBA-like thioredoxin domain-containing protein n=1 Tax=Streptomyces dioscori TaxID=2109333 RepID=A0A2P8Q9P4_9ACTN|nr:hypothetical protein C6Y14_12365 [Streptomyces dioscori]